MKLHSFFNFGRFHFSSVLAGLLAFGAPAVGDETDPSTNAVTTLVVGTRDGSKLVGQISTPTLGIEATVIGRLEVNLKRLAGLRRETEQGSLTATMLNGDRLVGELALTELRLRTAFGEVAVPRDQILSIGVRRTPSTAGLRHRWSAEGDAHDAAGTAHGKASSAVTYGAGQRGRAFVFAGEAEGVRFDEPVGSFGVKDFTLTFWLRSGKRSQIEYVMSKREACQPVKLWEVRLEADGRIALALGDVQDGFAPVHLTSRSRVNDGAWHLVAFTRQRETVSVFVDGQPETSELTPFVFDFTIAAPLILGSGCCAGQARTTHFGGQLDEVTLYDRPLQPAEIEALLLNP